MSTVTATPPTEPLAAPDRGVVAPKVSKFRAYSRRRDKPTS